MSSVTKIKRISSNFFERDLKDSDRDLFDSISQEFVRQKNHIELIASETTINLKWLSDPVGTLCIKLSLTIFNTDGLNLSLIMSVIWFSIIFSIFCYTTKQI